MSSEAGYFPRSAMVTSFNAIVQLCLQHAPEPTSMGISFPLPQGGSSQRYIFERIEPQWTLQAAQVFHEFEKDDVVYIVMEEIQGETIEQLAIGPLDGSLMEHHMFPDLKAATHYGSKAALGDHIKRIFKLTRDNLDVDFEEDARILWPADFHGANFKFVGEKVYWFDYRNVNVLPESFQIHDLTNSRHWIASNIGRRYLGLQPTTKSSMASYSLPVDTGWSQLTERPLPYLSRQTKRTIANAAAIQRATLRLWTSEISNLGKNLT
ncbi:hypothetical protein M407DRAFT_230662 [Tulasnella calospora MUT 4182]|uniref:Uncharacterized protein n=1 Tax=Tulasnella calospora MUT 4182 TaxID=1051891 RepID=A0A0C3Q2T9_9AGAM|nr:hypothetical protein M407DRAFT_230662 [Tulasnella calospora MUT 4182]